MVPVSSSNGWMKAVQFKGNSGVAGVIKNTEGAIDLNYGYVNGGKFQDYFRTKQET